MLLICVLRVEDCLLHEVFCFVVAGLVAAELKFTLCSGLLAAYTHSPCLRPGVETYDVYNLAIDLYLRVNTAV